MASALAGLGVKGAWVVRSEDGLDEISPFGPTRVSVLSNGRVDEGVVTPEDFGLLRSPAGAIDGGDAQRNAGILREVLSGAPHAARGALVLNAAAGLAIAKDLRLQDAAALAEKMLDSGKARETLESWKTAAKAKAPGVAS
jgi:anthranilate phosphoribosyltransferase